MLFLVRYNTADAAAIHFTLQATKYVKKWVTKYFTVHGKIVSPQATLD